MCSTRYEIGVEGVLDEHWSDWFDGMQIVQAPGGITIIAGPVADQAALHGLLARIRDLNLTLTFVRRSPNRPSAAAMCHHPAPEIPPDAAPSGDDSAAGPL